MLLFLAYVGKDNQSSPVEGYLEMLDKMTGTLAHSVRGIICG